MSPSVWRVWIEMQQRKQRKHIVGSHPPCGGCGLKFESIDALDSTPSHPPCGGCGLKYLPDLPPLSAQGHPPCGGCGLKCKGDGRDPAHRSVTLRVEGVD